MKIDLSDPAHAYTVWIKNGPQGVDSCGQRRRVQPEDQEACSVSI